MGSINSYAQYRSYFGFSLTEGTPATGIVYAIFTVGNLVGAGFAGPAADVCRFCFFSFLGGSCGERGGREGVEGRGGGDGDKDRGRNEMMGEESVREW